MEASTLSVVVVSDYSLGVSKSWRDEIAILKALARQDIEEAYPVYLVENERYKNSVPDELFQIYPKLMVLFSPAVRSSQLKDYALQHITSEYIAVFEADCIPNASWLSILSTVLIQNPEISVVSGRTGYGDESMYKRVLTVLDRSWDNPGKATITSTISNNGHYTVAVYWKNILTRMSRVRFYRRQGGRNPC